MGRLLFRFFHNMVPVWFSFLKILKKAPKSLPSISNQIGSRYIIVTTLQCGRIQTDSFSYDRSVLSLRCAKPQAESFRIDGAAECENSSSGVSKTTGSPGTTSDTEATRSMSSPSIIHDNEVFDRSEEACDQSFALCAYESDEDGYETEENYCASASDSSCSLSSDCFEVSLSPTAVQQRDGRHPESTNNPGYEAEAWKEGVLECKDCQEGRRKPSGRHDIYRNSSLSRELPSVRDSATIVQEGFALVKYSQDPYFDFVKSISEMLLENGFWQNNDLEDLLHCYLSLNTPRHHSVIKRAFLDVLTSLTSRRLLELK